MVEYIEDMMRWLSTNAWFHTAPAQAYYTSLPPSTIPLPFLGLYYDLFKQIMIRHRQPCMYGTHVGELQDS